MFKLIVPPKETVTKHYVAKKTLLDVVFRTQPKSVTLVSHVDRSGYFILDGDEIITYKQDIEVDGYLLYGVIPLNRVENGVQCCCDGFEIVSEKETRKIYRELIHNG